MIEVWEAEVMGKNSGWMRAAGLVVGCFSLTGCFVKHVIQSEMSAYAEPSDGPMAHVRLIGSRNVKMYPNSACVSTEVPGSGYPAGPQLGGQRKRDLGMPKVAPMPKHFVEIAARVDQPLTAGFSFYSESTLPSIAGTGMPTSRSSSACVTAVSFIPQVGLNYEVTASGAGWQCSAQVVQLVEEADGQVHRVPVPSHPAGSCTAAPPSA